MSRTSVRSKQPYQLSFDDSGLGIVLVPVPFWAPPKGMDTIARLGRLEEGFARLVRNMRLRDRTMQSRLAIETHSGDTAADIMAIVPFLTSNGRLYLIRFLRLAVHIWNGTSWSNIPVPGGLSGGLSDYFTFTSFNDNLLFSNGIDGLFDLNVNVGAITLIDGAPACKHLTTFTGRVIASNVRLAGLALPTRIQWSVKNNSHDWDGIGSGFEDLLSTPGGTVDQQRGVYPISDFTAIILRSSSVWQASETGIVDAPFRFSRIYDTIGTDSPYSAAPIPGGVIALMNDDVYLITESGFKPLGSRVRRDMTTTARNAVLVGWLGWLTTSFIGRLVSGLTLGFLAWLLNDSKEALVGLSPWFFLIEADDPAVGPTLCIGVYDPDEREYRLLIPPHTVWVYSFRDEGWTQDTYSQFLNYMAYSKAAVSSPLTIDSATGTIDDAGVATIDSEVGPPESAVMYFTEPGGTGRVFKEGTGPSDDGSSVVDEIISGLMQAGSPLERTIITEIQLEYESDLSADLFIEYREGTAAAWIEYERVILVVTAGPTIGKATKTITGRNLQFRLTTSELGSWRLLSFIPFELVAQNDVRNRP